jgi:hypothetical protein
MGFTEQRPIPGNGDNMTALMEKTDDHEKQHIPKLTPESDSGVILVDYDEDDPENPTTWSSKRKWIIVFAISWMGFVR